MSRVAAVIALGLAAAGVIASISLARVEIVNRTQYGTFSLSGPPPRIDWCGRRFYPATRTLSRSQAEAASLPAPGWPVAPFEQAGKTPSGLAYYARNAGAALRGRGLPCAMAIYLELRSDEFLPYGLSGGP